MRTGTLLLTLTSLLLAAPACWAPPAARIGDTAQSLPHVHTPLIGAQVSAGPILVGAATVMIGGKPAARINDTGVGGGCVGPNSFSIIAGSSTVLIEGKPAARMGDRTLHCGMAPGTILTGVPTVLIGD